MVDFIMLIYIVVALYSSCLITIFDHKQSMDEPVIKTKDRFNEGSFSHFKINTREQKSRNNDPTKIETIKQKNKL